MNNYHLNKSQVFYEFFFNIPLRWFKIIFSVPKKVTSVEERFNYRMYIYVYFASTIIAGTSSLIISDLGSPGVRQNIYSGIVIGTITYIIARFGYLRVAVYISALLAAFSSPLALWYANAPVDTSFTYLLLISVLALPYLGIFLPLREYIWWSIFILVSNTLFIYVIGQYPFRQTAFLLDEISLFITIAFVGAVFVGLRDRHIKQLLHTISLSEELLEKIKVGTIQEEKLLEQAKLDDQAKNGFLTSMSYHLRTPLSPIMTFSKLLLRNQNPPLPDNQRIPIDRVHINAKHLLTIINDILDVTHITSGNFSLKLSDVTILDILRDVKLMTEGAFIDGKVELIFPDISHLEIPILTVDHQRISQLLINIIGNARKFTLTGQVVLSVDKLADGIKIMVQDTGPGIKPDDYSSIFTAFEQGEAGKLKGGTGLGMPISRAVARGHGGDLTFVSELGVGTTFVLYLPYQSNTKQVELE